jgi:uncharacterized protein with HEPN domain
MSQRDDRTYLDDAIGAIDAAMGFVAGHTKASLEADEQCLSAVLYKLTVLGEALARVSPAMRSAHPELPWRHAIGLRNRVVHAYSDVDVDIVWKTVQTDLPSLRSRLHAIAAGLNGS